MSVRVETSHEGAVLRLVLDAPPANVLDAASIDALADAVRAANARVMLVVFDHEGPHFSYGASVAEHRRAEAPAMLTRLHGLFRLLLERAIPTAALVRGRCLGGGLELASFCTWLVAAPGASFGQPEVKLAVFPPMASILLPWRIGGGAALDLCVSGRTIDAAEAARVGLVTRLADDPRAWLDGFFAEHLAPGSAAALRFAERAARADLAAALDARLPALERLYLDELMATHDAEEGLRAFLAKEAPRYAHR